MKNIKKLSGILICFWMGSSFAAAGLLPKIGLEGGINLASLNGQNANDVFGSRVGFVGGAFLNFPLGPSLALQPELLYEQKGGNFGGTPYRLDYMEVPVLLNITLGTPEFNPGILLGPAFSTNVASEGVANVNSSDVGLIIGAQVAFSAFNLSGRYEVGLDDISSGQKVQNCIFSLMAGFAFI